ncbi:hypothetical protein MBLNU230_g3678t1 [Neophaeotheca triangularis]
MVKERSPSRASSGQHFSPHKGERQPLANISAKMQSPSSKQGASKDAPETFKAPQQAEFGTASPLRNPLKNGPQESNWQKPAEKKVEQYKPYPAAVPQYQNRTFDPFAPQEPRSFYLPGQAPRAPTQQQPNSVGAARTAMAQPYQRSFQPPVPIPRPHNTAPTTIQPPSRPGFSSLAPNNLYQAYTQPPPKPKQTVDLTQDDDEGFNPDAEIAAERGGFGAPDPYMYVDSSQANENIKALLEGAFDDEDKPKTRLRKRAKKAKEEDKETRSLADRLATLDVEDKRQEGPKPEEDEDEEDGTVEGLKCKLLPHQVEGVAWMIDKENGIRKNNRGVLPKGGILADDMGLGKTIQSVSLLLTNPRPGPDAKPEHPKQKLPSKEVGKGTLVVAPLALIKQWEAEIKDKVSKSHAMKVLVHHGPSRTKSSYELKKYDVVITTYQILASEHAGSNMTVEGGSRVGCFGVHWYRVILDEAHSIKNKSAKSTQACCALNSWYRWCLTGTPMQNNLDELQSLIKFLRIKPYCEVGAWKDSIMTPMKNGRGGLAMRRLQLFLRAFMKRRTKDILKKEGALNFGGKPKEGEEKSGGMQIVKREIVHMECEFNEEEQEFYTRLQERANDRLDDMVKKGHNAYMGALVMLLRLRQVCDHPHLIEKALNKDKDALSTGIQSPTKKQGSADDEMDDLAAMMGGVSVAAKNCDVCQIKLSADEASEGGTRCGDCEADLAALKSKKGQKKSKKVKRETKAVKQEEAPKPRMRNRKILQDSDDEDDEGEWIGEGPERHISLGKAGGTDDEDAEGGGETLDSIDTERDEDDSEISHQAGHNKSTAEHEDDDRDVDSASDSDSVSPPPVLAGMRPSAHLNIEPSTKIRHLLRILHTETPQHKTIVFSQFTSMLDLIEPHLHHSAIRFARYDGSMRNDAREASLNALRNDAKTRILLCSLKCGSLGLNLTAASRVVILEPFWNPFVEEQAIDRVHRLNQTVDVKVFRLTVKDSVEEKILALQEKKRELAKAAIEGGKEMGKLSMKDILGLFRRDAEDGAGHEDDVKYSGLAGGKEVGLLEKDGGGMARKPVAAVQQSARPVGGTVDDRKAQRDRGSGQRAEHAVYGRRW